MSGATMVMSACFFCVVGFFPSCNVRGLHNSWLYSMDALQIFQAGAEAAGPFFDVGLLLRYLLDAKPLFFTSTIW